MGSIVPKNISNVLHHKKDDVIPEAPEKTEEELAQEKAQVANISSDVKN